MNNIDFVLILLAVICFALLDAFGADLKVKLVSLGFAFLALTLIV